MSDSQGQPDIAGIHAPTAGAGTAALLLATLVVCVAPASPAQADASATITPPPSLQTSATIAPSLFPNRLGAKAALTFTIHYAGARSGLPSPVRRSVLRFPAGMSLAIPHLSSCAPARLRTRGPRGCPAQSALGTGHALVESHAGTLTIAEDTTLSAFLGPPQNLQPTFEILAQGYTPLDRQTVLTGRVLPDRAPYGEKLEMSIPPIPTMQLEPDASIVSFTLTIGTSRRHGTHAGASVLVPSSCPVGGLPFGAEFAYADDSSGSALATTPCPAKPRAHAARTISLNETGRLHLTSKHNFTLNEQGSASGTATGTIYVHLTLVSSSRATAEVNIYPRGGSLSGHGTASYHRSGATASFAGSMSIDRGTGSYARVHGSGLSFNGTIQESKRDDPITVHVSGRVSD